MAGTRKASHGRLEKLEKGYPVKEKSGVRVIPAKQPSKHQRARADDVKSMKDKAQQLRELRDSGI